MKPIIEVQNLSKKYQINAQKQRYLSIRDSLSSVFSFNKNRGKEAFWALKDIDFKIEAGESVGIIGRNGAGKSTLLKILSRITPPTKGQIILRGRVASLLEVGTGFHPELTGRENVYFNGSILGLRKAEIDKKFDEIVNFSGVEQFIDTPLKQYSSGMQLRLAFAVAAHLEPEILVIDEVLAVGDAEFQKKCLGKMGEVSKSGRTVLFVSHNTNMIQKLCSRGILLEKGIISLNDSIKEVIEKYIISKDIISNSEVVFDLKNQIGFTKLAFLNSKKERTPEFYFGEPFEVFIEVESNFKYEDVSLVVAIDTADNIRICTSISSQAGKLYTLGKKICISAKFAGLILHPGEYYLHLSLRKAEQILDSIFNAGKFKILKNSYDNITIYQGNMGLLRFNPEWSD